MIRARIEAAESIPAGRYPGVIPGGWFATISLIFWMRSVLRESVPPGSLILIR